MSNNLSYYASDKLIDHLTGKASYTSPTVYVALSSTTPTVSGTNVTEPSGGSYARVTTSASTWNSAASGATTNALAITFPQATADWASGSNFTYGVLYDAPTGGNMLGFGLISVAKSVLSGDQANISAASLSITFN